MEPVTTNVTFEFLINKHIFSLHIPELDVSFFTGDDVDWKLCSHYNIVGGRLV